MAILVPCPPSLVRCICGWTSSRNFQFDTIRARSKGHKKSSQERKESIGFRYRNEGDGSCVMNVPFQLLPHTSISTHTRIIRLVYLSKNHGARLNCPGSLPELYGTIIRPINSRRNTDSIKEVEGVDASSSGLLQIL